MYSFSCLLERAWRFGMPLVLAFLPGGFQAIAILGFAAPLACSLAGPSVRPRSSWAMTYDAAQTLVVCRL